MNDPFDDELIRMYRAGDADAFDVLFDRHHVSVYNFARTIVGDAPLAEEVMQDTFLAVARTASNYSPEGKFRSWLLRITRNRCLNMVERERNRRKVFADCDFHLIEAPVDEPDPEHAVAASDDVACVRRAIGVLPDRQREAITLYAFEHLTYAEIACVLDLPINTVKTLIRRARLGLARALNNDSGQPR